MLKNELTFLVSSLILPRFVPLIFDAVMVILLFGLKGVGCSVFWVGRSVFWGDWVGDVISEVVGGEGVGFRDVDHVRRVVCWQRFSQKVANGLYFVFRLTVMFSISSLLSFLCLITLLW